MNMIIVMMMILTFLYKIKILLIYIMDKIAFMFLLYDKIQHQELWEKFFSEDPNKERHTIYSHPKLITKKTPQWIVENKVKTVKTDWCSENLVKALCQMLKEALKDKSNKYFALLSGACIPLLTFNKTYKKINKLKKTQLYFYTHNDLINYKASQWVIYTRKTAKDLVRLYDRKDKIACSFLNKQHDIFEKPKTKKRTRKNSKKKSKYKPLKWEEKRIISDHGGCPDEFYPINWFVSIYGSPKSKKFKKYIEFKLSTWYYMDEFADHPIIINKNNINKYKKVFCNSFFARKFTKESAKIIGMSC